MTKISYADLVSAIGKLASDTMLKAFTINPELPKFSHLILLSTQGNPTTKMKELTLIPANNHIDDLFIYNARDACVTKEIDLAMDDDLDESRTKRLL